MSFALLQEDEKQPEEAKKSLEMAISILEPLEELASEYKELLQLAREDLQRLENPEPAPADDVPEGSSSETNQPADSQPDQP